MTGEIKQPPGHEDYYSGLEVVETAPEVVDTSHLPEVSHGPEAGFAEHKQYSPPQALSHPYGQPHSPESVPPHSEQSFNGQHQYGGGGDPFKPTRDERILGLKKKVFWMVVALFGAGIVIGLAVGLGVGLGVTSSNSSSSSSSSTSSSTMSATTLTTTTLPAATATATANSSTEILCPAANKTLYTLATSATARKFIVLCGRDYNSDGGAQDIVSVNTTTFEGCLDQCGSTDGCTAVGWGNYYGINTCWLKSSIGVPSWSASWYAAVEDDSG